MSEHVDGTARVTRHRLKVAAAIGFAFFVAYFDRTNVAVLIANDQFTHDLGIADNKLKQGLLLSAFLFPYGFANFVAGPLVDRIGGRRAIAFAIVSWTVCMALMGLISSFPLMIALRIILGLGESIMTPACNLIVTEWFPDSERARANSAWLAGLFFAPAVSFPVIIWIVDVLDWRASFFVLAAIGLLAALPAIMVWTSDRPETHPKASEAEVSYIRRGQARTEQPAFSWANARRLFSNYRFWLCAFAYTGDGLGFWGMSAFVPSYFEHARHMSFTSAGMFGVLPWLTAAVMTILGGMVGDRRTGMRVHLWSGGYILAGLLSYLGIETGMLSASVVLISAAIGLLSFTLGPMWAIVQELSPPGMTGLGAGVVNGIGFIASAFGPALVGAVVDRTGSYALGFYLLAGWLVVTGISLAPMWPGYRKAPLDARGGISAGVKPSK